MNMSGYGPTRDPVRPEKRVKLSLEFLNYGPQNVVAQCEPLGPGAIEGLVTMVPGKPDVPVEVLVYESDLPRWQDLVEEQQELWPIVMRTYEENLRVFMAGFTGKHLSDIPRLSTRDSWSDDMVMAEASAPYTCNPYAVWHAMVHRGIKPFKRIEILERGLPPPRTDAERMQEAQSATIARSIREALGGTSSSVSGTDLNALIQNAVMAAIAPLQREVDSLKSQLGIDTSGKKKG